MVSDVAVINWIVQMGCLGMYIVHYNVDHTHCKVDHWLAGKNAAYKDAVLLQITDISYVDSILN